MGRLACPVRLLSHFEKQDFRPGETRELTFAIQLAKDLSYSDASGQRRREVGFFTLRMGGQSRRFRYVGTRAELVGRR